MKRGGAQRLFIHLRASSLTKVKDLSRWDLDILKGELNSYNFVAVISSLTKLNIAKLQFKEEIEANNTISMDDFRRSFFFLMFILLSFFGTGNIASVSSFDVSWVRCFLTVFAPFTMMTIILLKTVIPFLLVTCCFRAISIISKVKAETVCVTVLIYCDIMGLHFFHSVTNKGSWLQIGSSVSHFVIMEVTVLFLAVLYYIARLYTSTVIVKSTTLDTPIFPLWEPLDKKLKRR